MNLLLITPYIPYPLTEGGKISQFAIIDYLRNRINITLLLTIYNNEDEINYKLLCSLWPNVKMEIIYVKSDIPSLTFLNKVKRKISNTIYQPTDEQPIISNLEEEAKLFWYKSKDFINTFSKVISDCKPDLIQIDLLSYVDLVFCLPETIKKVFVHHEIRFARILSTINALNKTTPYDDYILNSVKNYEVEILRKFDGVIVFSEDDKSKLIDVLPDKRIYMAPFPVLNKAFKPIVKDNLIIKKLVFLGGENHYPNKDAVEWYMNDIVKIVQERNDIILHVIGKWSEETMLKYKGNKTIHFAGFVDDVSEYCINSIMIVPVRIGSGIRTKILYSMAYGVPVISASIGCEGINGSNGSEFMIADTPHEFAMAIYKLVNDIDFTNKIAMNAQNLALKDYSQEAAGEIRLMYLNEILDN